MVSIGGFGDDPGEAHAGCDVEHAMQPKPSDFVFFEFLPNLTRVDLLGSNCPTAIGENGQIDLIDLGLFSIHERAHIHASSALEVRALTQSRPPDGLCCLRNRFDMGTDRRDRWKPEATQFLHWKQRMDLLRFRSGSSESDDRHEGDWIWHQDTAPSSNGMRFGLRRPAV